jgi:uncharacterized Zn finger protein
MAREFNGEWPPYVPVAERRKKAAREIERLRKKGHPVAPVLIEGRAIARTFWGRAWCDNLESYRDYENRLPRGRTYVCHGAVVDLQISALKINAMVSGSSIYRITIALERLPPARWHSICEDCAGGINSLIELLQGRFSKSVMERLCRQDKGLFPKPSEIRFSCTCPDGASMCKHVAAVLYGVGARLDEKPELLFRLRAVNPNDLLAGLDKALPYSNQPLDAGKVLEADDVSALFGLDLEGTGGEIVPKSAAPAPRPAADQNHRASTTTRVAAPRSLGEHDKSSADPEANRGVAQQALVPTTPPTKQASVRRIGGKSTNSGKATDRASPLSNSTVRTGSKNQKSGKRSKVRTPAVELTPDGFVKWWK